MTYVRTKEDLALIDAIYELEKELEKNPNSEKKDELLKKIQSLVDKNNSKFNIEILGSDGKVDLSRIHSFRADFENTRNKVDVRRDLELYVNLNGNFGEFPQKDKEKIIRTLARALKYPNDNLIKSLLSDISSELRIDVSSDGIKKLIETTLGIKIESQEDLDKFNAETELNLQSSERKLELIRRDLEADPDKGNMSVREARNHSEKRDKYKRISESFSNKITYMTITDELEKSFNAGNQDAILELVAVYVEYHYEKEEVYKNILRNYIKINEEYISEYFKNTYPNEKIIHGNNGTVNVDETRKFLRNHEFSEDSKLRMEKIKECIERYHEKGIEAYDMHFSEGNNPLFQYIEEDGRNATVTNEEEIVRCINSISPYAYSESIINYLKNLNSKRISQAIEDNFNKAFEAEGFPKESYNKEKISLNFLGTLEKDVLVMENKLDNSKGKPEYLAICKERDELYSKNPYYQIILSKYRDDKGELTDYGRQQFADYNDNLVKNSINELLEKKPDITKLTKEQKDNYMTFLLAGLEIKDMSVQEKCIDALKKIYPEYNNERGRKFKNLIYQRVFGAEYKDNSQKVDSLGRTLKNNVIKQLMNATNKIPDNEFEAGFANDFVNLDITAIDFSKSELENSFNDSRVEFSAEDERKMLELYEQYANAAIVKSKSEAIKQRYLTQYKYVLDAEKDSHYNAKPARKQLEQILKENPELKNEIFDENGEILQTAMEENEKYRTNTLFFNSLHDSIAILKDPTKYEDMKVNQKMNILEIGILMNGLARNEMLTPENRELIGRISKAILEKGNTEKRKFVETNSFGKVKFNQDEITKEYNTLSGRNARDISDVSKFVFKKCSVSRVIKSAIEYSYLNEEDFNAVQDNMNLTKILEVKAEMYSKYRSFSKSKAIKSSVERRYGQVSSSVSFLKESDLDKTENPYLLAMWYNQKYSTGAETNPEQDIKLYDELFKQRSKSEIGIKETLSELREKLENASSPSFSKDQKELEGILGKATYDNMIKLHKENLKAQILGPDPSEKMLDEKTTGLIGDITNFSKESIDTINNLNVSAIWYYNAMNEAKRRGQADLLRNLAKDFKTNFEEHTIETAFEDVRTQISAIIDDQRNLNDIDPDDVKKQILGEETYNFINNNKTVNKSCNYQEQEYYHELLDEMLSGLDEKSKINFITTSYKKHWLSEQYGDYKTKGTECIERYILSRKDEFKEFLLEDNTIDFKKINDGSTSYDNGKLSNLGYKLKDSYESLGQKNRILKDKIEFVSIHIGQSKNSSDNKKFYDNLRDILDENESRIQNGDKSILSADFLEQIYTKEQWNYSKAVIRNAQAKNDTIADYAKAVVRLGKSALKELPKVIIGKESRSEFLDKVVQHTTNGVERITGRMRKIFSKDDKRESNLLDGGSKLALTEAQKEESQSSKGNILDRVQGELNTEANENMIKSANSERSDLQQDVFRPIDNRYGSIEAAAQGNKKKSESLAGEDKPVEVNEEIR